MKTNEIDITQIVRSTVEALEASVRRNLCDGLLLSGGLDTSLIACLAAKYRKPDCITVAFSGAPAPDIEYAVEIAELFRFKHTILKFEFPELEEAMRDTIRILKTFDPMEVRNSAAAYIGLKLARDQGLKTVYTGDGGDELFAGYSFYFDMTKEQLDSALSTMWKWMRFSSVPLSEALGISVKLPILDPEFQSFAKQMDSSLKVRVENGKMYGKWILRKAFKGLLPERNLWRVKAPLEVGTGTTILPQYFESRISDADFNKKQKIYLNEDNVRLRSKEHLFCYEIYRKQFGSPGIQAEGKKCPDCHASVEKGATYCPTCGAYPI
jgi:asparagine synthase (glutamine-hydrolysing)